MSKGWDTAALRRLKALTGKGLSTAEIGRRLGMSKNAIVGKLNRLGWNSKAGVDEKTLMKQADAAKKVAAAKKPAAAPAKKTVAKPAAKSASKNLAMHQRIIQHSLGMAGLRPDQCRWPIGDPDSENFHFCGCQVFVGKPYCYEHCLQAYQFTPPKKK
jgi:GcrA cell cycle regulator